MKMSKPVSKMRPIHPGEILSDEMEALELSARALGAELKVAPNRITGIMNGTRAVTADTALRFSAYFGTTAEFWMNLQKTYELRLAETTHGREIRNSIKRRAA